MGCASWATAGLWVSRSLSVLGQSSCQQRLAPVGRPSLLVVPVEVHHLSQVPVEVPVTGGAPPLEQPKDLVLQQVPDSAE